MESELSKLLNGNFGIVMVFIIWKLSQALFSVIREKMNKDQPTTKEIETALNKEQDGILRSVYHRTKAVHEALSKTDSNGRPLHVFPSDNVEAIPKILNLLDNNVKATEKSNEVLNKTLERLSAIVSEFGKEVSTLSANLKK